MEKIKLVIWDLDETFWKGTLSEEGISVIEKNIKIVKELTDRGIINSIASKNDFNKAKEKLKEIGVWEYFIFPKIAWLPKGQMVQEIITKSQLRPINVLFIDDNHMNLKEIKFYNPSINTANPNFLEDILTHPAFKGKDDKTNTRLKQYKILEKKEKDKVLFSDNTAFLISSNIKVSVIHKLEQNIDRIHELLERANQLNYTKKRPSKEEVKKLLQNKDFENACISVKDKYGDYGVVGFYSLNKKNASLEHFVLSCRILNLGVEQYIYSKLSFPKLDIKGEVITQLNKKATPFWINRDHKEEKRKIRKNIQK